jgi:flavin-dependent dehydrogenase
MVHCDEGRVSLSCCIRRDTLEEARRGSGDGNAADAVLRHILQSCTGARRHLERARLRGKWLAAGPINPGFRSRFADGIFRTGNVAGEAHPIVAEGISMAIQSSYLLCRHLLKRPEEASAGRALAEVGDAYSAEWQSRFATRLRAAAVFAHVAMRPSSAYWLLPILRQFPATLTWGAALSGKTSLLPV